MNSHVCFLITVELVTSQVSLTGPTNGNPTSTVEWNVQKLLLKHLQLLLGPVCTVWGCIVVLRDHTLWRVQVLCELPHILVIACLQWAFALVIVFQVYYSLCSPDYKYSSFYSRQTHTDFFDCWRNCVFPLHFSLFHLRSEVVHISSPVTRDSRNSLNSCLRWKQSQNLDVCAVPPDILVLCVHALWYHSYSWHCYIHFWCKIAGQQIYLEVWLITFPKWVPPPVLCLHPSLTCQADQCHHHGSAHDHCWTLHNFLTCCSLIMPSPLISYISVNLWWISGVETCFAHKTKSPCYLLCGTKFPLPLQ